MIILFDIDGVLIESLAYRAALQQTVAYFSRRLGLGPETFTLTDADIEVYESQGITVEWESGAISVAALLLERWRTAPLPPNTPAEWWALLERTAAQPVTISRPDFSSLARQVGAAARAGFRPATVALDLLTVELKNRPFAQASLLAQLLDQLLGHCTNIERAPVTQIFQNYVIGHRQYAETYGRPPLLESEPLLEKLDRPLLQSEWRDRLLADQAAGRIYIALYTARPSLPPAESGTPVHGYTPEAEIARRLAGLEGVPVIGWGKIYWLAQETGRTATKLIKPAPTHALAALAAARTGQEAAALQAALAAQDDRPLAHPLTACAGETVHVFEDSAGGLVAVRQAIAGLARRGMHLRLACHGIAAPSSSKRPPLERTADFVHADINEGVGMILHRQ